MIRAPLSDGSENSIGMEISLNSRQSARVERWTLVATVIATSMAFIDTTALNIALPAVQSDLGATGAQLLWIMNAYALFLSALILVGGSMGDIYGRKRVFMVGIGLFTLASIICGLAPTTEVLILARAGQGIGGALMMPGSLALITAVFTAERRGAAIGTWSMFSTLMTILGPVLGGWLAGQGLWRIIFLINVPLALVALGVLSRYVPESRNPALVKGLDYPGALLAMLGLGALTYGFIEAPNFGLNDPRILGTLGFGLVALAAFIVVELRSDHPMVPLGLFRSRTFTGTNLITLLMYAAVQGSLFFLPLNLIQIQGYPQVLAGLANLPFAFMLIVLARWSGGLVARIGPRPPLIIGPLIAGFGFLLFAVPGLTAGPSEYFTTFFPAALVLGVGFGIAITPLTTAVMGSAPRGSSGTASGINNAIARTAGVLAIAILGALALTNFSGLLAERAAALPLTEAERVELKTNAVNFADTRPPAGIEPALAERVQTAIASSFIDSFRITAVIAAVLAWLSSLAAALFVERRLAPPA